MTDKSVEQVDRGSAEAMREGYGWAVARLWRSFSPTTDDFISEAPERKK